MQSQGTKREPSQRNAPLDRDQLERSAEMFEMILRTAPETVQNYLTLKDIYKQLNRQSDLKRIVKGLAQLYLASGQPERAAKEYVEVLETDPSDGEALDKLREIGYAGADIGSLKLEADLEETRRRCEEKLRELREVEEAFLKASAKARDTRRGEDEETRRVLQAIEEKKDAEMHQLIAEHERWLNEGEGEVFNQVAESLKKKADQIIQEDEFNDIRKSVKKAEKLLASTDSVFQQEWKRVSDEREREFHERVEELKRRSEIQLRTAWQDVVARAEQEQAAADLSLRKLKDELRELQADLKEKEKVAQKAKPAVQGQPVPPRLKQVHAPSGVVVVAPQGSRTPSEPPEETVPEPVTRRTSRDEVGKALGAILVQHGVVSRERLEEAVAKQAKGHKPIGQILVESGYASEEDIINALVAQAGVPYLPLANYEISDEIAMMIPKELAVKHALMPVDKIANSLLVAMGIPLTREQKEEVQRQVGGMRISYFISSWSHIKAKHEQHYS